MLGPSKGKRLLKTFSAESYSLRIHAGSQSALLWNSICFVTSCQDGGTGSIEPRVSYIFNFGQRESLSSSQKANHKEFELKYMYVYIYVSWINMAVWSHMYYLLVDMTFLT